MNDSSPNVLMVFVKYPKPGCVKTRLAQDIGEEAAANLYRDMAISVIEGTTASAYQQKIYYSPANKLDEFLSWLGSKKLVAQHEGDLGERLYRAFLTEFEGGSGKVIVVGTDCVELDQRVVENAFKVLDKNDAVIGPCYDGGYYLLGLRRCNKKIFEMINWSSSLVLEQTCQNLEQLGYSYKKLDLKRDIDTLDDLNKCEKLSFLAKASKY